MSYSDLVYRIKEFKWYQKIRKIKYDCTFKPLISMIPDGQFRILDIGCSEMIYDELIVNARPGSTVQGIDVLERKSDSSLAEGLSFQKYSGGVLPYEDSSFDIVIMMDMLHHCGNPQFYISEAARVINDEGNILLLDGSCKTAFGAYLFKLQDSLRGNLFNPSMQSTNPILELDIENMVGRSGLSIEDKRYHREFMGVKQVIYSLSLQD